MKNQVYPGQVYENNANGRRVRVYAVYDDRARVTDIDGRYPRSIAVSHLHRSATTSSGRPRRTGYTLNKDTSLSGPWSITPRGGASFHPWEWSCGIRTCNAWGMARTWEKAEEQAADHHSRKHNQETV